MKMRRKQSSRGRHVDFVRVGSGAGRSHRRRRGLPRVESIEPRLLLSAYTVNTLSDAANPGVGLMTLRQAVAAANLHLGADTIGFALNVFTPGSLHTIKLLSGELLLTDISGATAINGPGTAVVAVNGNNAGRLFDVNAGVTVSITGLTITGGFALNGGFSGGIYSAGALTLNAVTVTGNKVDGNIDPQSNQGGPGLGGGIYSTGTLVLQSSTVSSNSATGGSNVLSQGKYQGEPADGGGIYSIGPLTITSSIVSSNTAVGGDDVIRFQGGDGGDALGGGVYAAGALSITSSTIQNNHATGGSDSASNNIDQGSGGAAGNALGGGIYAGGKSAAIASSQVSGNSAQGGNAQGYGDFAGEGRGGGAYAAGALTITASTFSGNSADGADGEIGGGSSGEGGGVYCNGSLVLNQSTISGNAVMGGAGEYPEYGGPGGEAMGGGIFAASAMTVFQSSITGNSATGGPGSYGQSAPPVYASAGGSASGGGAWCGGSAVITDSTIANNQSIGGRGGDALDGGVRGGHAGNGGDAEAGGLDARAALQLRDSTVSGNAAVGGSGGQGYNSNPNIAPIPDGAVGAASAGGILAIAVKPLFNNSIISANKAGGAFHDIVATAQSSSGFNLIGVGGGLSNGVNGNRVGINNPKLSPLGNYGGPTQTMPPIAGSPAVDAGSKALIPVGLTADQRGLPRVLGKSVDIGADEAITVTLTGSVFNDGNGDGIRQNTDPGLAALQVYIDLNNVGVFVAGDPIATTDASGNYTLTYQPATTKSLIIREIRPGALRRTKPAGIYPLGFYTVNPISGPFTHLDFGNSVTGLITGSVFNDANSNGKEDATEKGLANFRVYVDKNKDGKFESNELSTLSDSSGNWSIAGLAPGTYVVRVVQPTGWKATAPVGGALTVTLTSGATITGEMFGERFH